MREAVAEALSQSADVQDASRLDAEGLLAVVGGREWRRDERGAPPS